ncbi:DUF6186 family protein [Gordonia sp. NPDC003424]
MRTVSIAIYVGCAVALLISALVVAARDREATPTAMFDNLMADRPARLAIVILWWWLGWHFLGEPGAA